MVLSTSKKTDPFFKQLLIQTEKSNLLREDLTFGTVCRLCPNTFDANETLKKKYKREFDQIKRRTESAYIKLLDSFEIPIGPALQRKLRGNPQSTNQEASSSSSSSDDSEEESTEENTPTEVETVPPVEELTEILQNISFPSFSQEITPVPHTTIPPTPPLSSLRKQIMFSPDTGSVASSTPTADVLSFIDVLEHIRQDGTHEYPYIIIVNEECAERNRGFDITLVPEIEHRGFTRNAFHIRKTVSVAHAELLEAYIPTVKYPTLADRAVMIRGPSQDFWNQDAERYHANTETINCPPTKKKHSAIQQAIGVDVSRQLEHTLLVFKRGTKLENHVFSDDAVYVDNVVVNDMTATIKNGDDDLEVLGTTVFWQIAVAGGSKLASGKPKKKKLFKAAP
jgi:hypothetical protein